MMADVLLADALADHAIPRLCWLVPPSFFRSYGFMLKRTIRFKKLVDDHHERNHEGPEIKTLYASGS